MAKRLRQASQSSDVSGFTEHANKYTTIDSGPTPCGHQGPATLRCDLHSHTLHFDTIEQYEVHYNKLHQNRCAECKKNFPSEHILNLHIGEQHDAFVAARRDRGEKTYVCLVEDCDKVCLDWKKRRSHLVDKHGFPRNFDFFIVATGIDGRKSLLRAGVDADGHRKSSRERDTDDANGSRQIQVEGSTDPSANVKKEEPEGVQSSAAEVKDQVSVADLTSSMSALGMVPRKVQFGRGRAGLSRD